jgi:tetratricopeptide (TPR) repeat protein
LTSGCQQTAVTSAKLYVQQANFDKAIEQCQEAIKLAPNDAEAYFVMGQAYGLKGMYKEMNQAFNKSLGFSNKHAVAIDQEKQKYYVNLFNNGVSSIKQAKPDKAIEEFSLAIEIFPNRIDAYKNLAYTYTQMNDYTKAIEVYNNAILKDSTDLELKTFLGILYYLDKKYEKAVESLKIVIEKGDNKSKYYAEALYNIAYSYDLLGQSDMAIKTYESALAMNPGDKDLMFNMGRLYFIQENYEKAIESFQNVLKSSPDDFETLLNIGNVYLRMTKFDQALQYFEKSIQIKPDNPTAWNNLGVCYVRMGKGDKAKEAFEKAGSLKTTE